MWPVVAARGANSPINISLSALGTGLGQDSFQLFLMGSVDNVAVSSSLFSHPRLKCRDALYWFGITSKNSLGATRTKQQINSVSPGEKQILKDESYLACRVLDTPRLQAVSHAVFQLTPTAAADRGPKPYRSLASVER